MPRPGIGIVGEFLTGVGVLPCVLNEMPFVVSCPVMRILLSTAMGIDVASVEFLIACSMFDSGRHCFRAEDNRQTHA